MSRMRKTYESALKVLESRRRPARPVHEDAGIKVNHAARASGTPDLRGSSNLAGMKEWLGVLGHSDDDIDRLNIIHISGTKGKGSTCAFTRSLLQCHSVRTGFPRRIGLYTSPHLRDIRERIQINEEPILPELFAKYFYEVWDRMEAMDSQSVIQNFRLPRYLQLLALVAFHAFIQEHVDAAVIETHHGGEYDVTNFIRRPVVTGITTVGIDHIQQLGPTIENIAWHKAGIIRSGSPAFSVVQDESVQRVLRNRARDRNTSLTIVPASTDLTDDVGTLSIPAQKINCSLAAALCTAFLEARAPLGQKELTASDILEGVRKFSWPGRYQVIKRGAQEWFLDGAHNDISLIQAADWFSRCVKAANISSGNSPRVLIYSQISDSRDGLDLLRVLSQRLSENDMVPEYVIFTTYQLSMKTIETIGNSPAAAPRPEVLDQYLGFWRNSFPQSRAYVETTIDAAMMRAENIGAAQDGMQTLITGSLYLVGGALSILQPLPC